MKTNSYSSWKETEHVLHMISQMMGKTKLSKVPAQPEWLHVLLPISPKGFTTGLIPDGDTSFEIHLDIRQSEVHAQCSSGKSARMPLYSGASISDYYAAFLEMLAYVDHEVEISPIPQEVPNTTIFPEQTEPLGYDAQKAHEYFELSMFVHNALLQFSAPFRGKKILPQLFWGTFDLTTVLFSNVEKPFEGGGIIEQVAFDEQFIEFGYWPGDAEVDEPQLFVLAYPFITKDLSGEKLETKGAYYSADQSEFFLSLSEALNTPDPMKTVVQFCRETFEILTEHEGWPHTEWFTKPLLCENEASWPRSHTS